MKVQIVNRSITPTTCFVEVKHEGMKGYSRIMLPTHEILTEESLKAAIKTAIDQLAVMKERMALLDGLMFQDIELDQEESYDDNRE